MSVFIVQMGHKGAHQNKESMDFDQSGGRGPTPNPNVLLPLIEWGEGAEGVYLIADSTTISSFFYNLQSNPKSTICNVQAKFG